MTNIKAISGIRINGKKIEYPDRKALIDLSVQLIHKYEPKKGRKPLRPKT